MHIPGKHANRLLNSMLVLSGKFCVGTFQSLGNRNFRIFFAGHGFSSAGQHMQKLAIGWLVYEMTGSAVLLGIVAFAREIGAAILTPFSGLVADCCDRRGVLLVCQILFVLQAAVFATLVMIGNIAVWQIVTLSILYGVIIAVEIPVRQSFTVDLVDKKSEIGNAVGLSVAVFNGAMMAGPAIAGLIIARAGVGVCMILCGSTYLLMFFLLLWIDYRPRRGGTVKISIFGELSKGAAYAYRNVAIRYILILMGISAFFALPHLMLMPVFAKDIISGGPRTLGYLMSAGGFGALAGGVYLAGRKSIRGLGRTIALNTLMLGIGLVAFSLSSNLTFAMLFMLLVGLGAMVQRSAANIVLQTIADDDKRGRVISLYVLSIIGMHSLGDLTAGYFSAVIGAPGILLIGGFVCIACAIAAYLMLPYLRRHTHPIYVRQGIMISPAMASTESD